MSDMMTRLGHSQIQHGKANDRIYLMKYDSRDRASIVADLDQLAVSQSYSKIFVKVPQTETKLFLEADYREEARIPGFYQGEIEYVFMGKYFTEDRSLQKEETRIQEVLAVAMSKEPLTQETLGQRPEGISLRVLAQEDAPAMAEVYREVFETYPFPIHDPAYLKETMVEHVVYFGAFHRDRLVAIASSETDREGLNCEMTDFATLPPYRGKNLSLHLLWALEKAMAEDGFKTFYTIARAVSYGMNATFAKAGYHFGGTLVNNTNISGKIESMNVWYKRLSS